MMKSRRSPVATVLITITLALLALSVIIPLVYMVLTSFKNIYEYLKAPLDLPRHFSLSNYAAMYSGYRVLAYLRNSAIVSVAALAVALLFTIPAAYAFAKIPFPGKGPIFRFILSLMMVPVMVTLIPRYIMYSHTALIDTLPALVLAYSAMSLPFTLYLLTANFRSIPNEMLEAARMDGAGFMTTVKSVVLPVGRTAIVTVSLINFVNFWNEVPQAMLFINSDRLRTMTAVVSSMGARFMSNMPLIMAGLVLTSLPTILIYVLFERQLEEGITMGSFR
jgi:ABC-type glycerol-3-phosphate transport system permease component